MTSDNIRKFIDACEAAGIKTYAFITDVSPSILYNGEKAIIKPSYEQEMAICIRSSNYAGTVKSFNNNIEILCANFADIHEIKLGCDYKQAQDFCNAIGDISLSDDDVKILLEIDHSNYKIKPLSGDYVDVFKYLSKKQYEELTPEEKAAYDAAKEEYEKKKREYIGENQAASITL